MADNAVTVRSAAGDATAAAGAALITGRMTDSVASGNSVSASSPRGDALAAGGAFVVDDRRLTLRTTTVRANTAAASGQSGAARGGGIFDARLFSDGAPLTLIDSSVVQNVAAGPPRINRQGEVSTSAASHRS